MIAAEPQVGSLRFHLAAAGGAWDEESEKPMFRGSVGMTFAVKKFMVRLEESIGFWKERISGSPDDALPHGGYIKFIYGFSPKVRGSLNVNYAYHNFVNRYNPEPGEEVYVTITPALQFLTTSSSRIILQVDLCDWKQTPSEGMYGEKLLRYVRGSLGWRLTF